MFIDKELFFADAGVVGGGDGQTDGQIGDIVDLVKAGDAYDDAWFVLRIDTAFEGGTSVVLSLQTSAAENFATSTDLISKTVTVASDPVTAGTVLVKQKLPPGKLRYLRVYGNVTGTFTGGKIDAFITPDVRLTLSGVS